jgi:hypothetical protein
MYRRFSEAMSKSPINSLKFCNLLHHHNYYSCSQYHQVNHQRLNQNKHAFICVIASLNISLFGSYFVAINYIGMYNFSLVMIIIVEQSMSFVLTLIYIIILLSITSVPDMHAGVSIPRVFIIMVG